MSKYYDLIYSSIVDYESQTDYIEKIFARLRGSRPINSILDVACGTGNYTFIFAKRGYKTTGIDLSKEMIAIALRKRKSEIRNTEFFQMDMRDIHLEEKFDAATVLFGGFGYLLQKKDVKRFFSSVRKALNPKGLLLFEFWQSSAVLPQSTTPQGLNTFDRIKDGNRLIIRLDTSKYNNKTSLLAVLFDCYVVDLKNKRLVDSFKEAHVIKTYSISEMRRLLEESGYKILAFYSGGVGKMSKPEPARQSAFRVLAAAKP